MNAALKAIETLKFEGPKTEPDFDLSVRKYGHHNNGFDFHVVIYGAGFEASRNLNREDLLTIREWIDEAILASAPETAAA